MRKALLILFACSFLMFAGCDILQRVAGNDPETGERIAPPGEAPLEQLGRALVPWVPWAGMAASAAGWIITRGGKKEYMKLALAGVEAVSEGKLMLDKDGKVEYKKLLENLARKQDLEGIREKARSMAHLYEKKLRMPPSA